MATSLVLLILLALGTFLAGLNLPSVQICFLGSCRVHKIKGKPRSGDHFNGDPVLTLLAERRRCVVHCRRPAFENDAAGLIQHQDQIGPAERAGLG
jgi:hypothetical protein